MYARAKEASAADNSFLRKAAAPLRVLALLLAIWLAVRFALGWFLPFLTAFLIARALEPPVAALTNRLRMPRAFASGLCAVMFFAAAIALVSLCAGRAVIELTALARRLPEFSVSVSETISDLLLRLRGHIASAPPELQVHINSALDGLSGRTAELATSVSKGIFSLLSAILSAGPKILLFLVACTLGTFFISGGYGEFVVFILRQIPTRHHNALLELKNDLFRTAWRWLRAQLMLSAVTFFELLTLFLLMRSEVAVLLALLGALLDMLPLIGTGALLLPWAVMELLRGDVPHTILLLAGYAVTSLVHNIISPRLIAGQLGLPPIAALVAMYVGYCVAGIIGMALFPIGLIMLKHLNDKGYMRLWK